MPSHSGQPTTQTTKIIVGTPLKKKNPTNTPTDLVVFRFEQASVLVKPVENYQDAQAAAKQEFHELSGIPKERIGFAVHDTGSTQNERGEIRISEGAWSTVVGKLPQGSIIHVIVRPDPDAKCPPPQYLEIPVSSSFQGRHSRSDLSINKPSSRSSSRSSKSSNGPFSWIGSALCALRRGKITGVGTR